MQISQELVDEFKEIHKKKTGEELDNSRAYAIKEDKTTNKKMVFSICLNYIISIDSGERF